MNENLITLWSYLDVHGATLQGFLALGEMPMSGTLIPSVGIVNLGWVNRAAICRSVANQLHNTNLGFRPFRRRDLRHQALQRSQD